MSYDLKSNPYKLPLETTAELLGIGKHPTRYIEVPLLDLGTRLRVEDFNPFRSLLNKRAIYSKENVNGNLIYRLKDVIE